MDETKGLFCPANPWRGSAFIIMLRCRRLYQKSFVPP